VVVEDDKSVFKAVVAKESVVVKAKESVVVKVVVKESMVAMIGLCWRILQPFRKWKMELLTKEYIQNTATK
jgi:hypothetical protein